MDMHVNYSSLADWSANASILEAFPSGVVVCDAQGLIVHCNSELLRLFGYSEQELLGHSINILLPEEFQAQHSAHLRAYMANPQKRIMGIGRELSGRRKNGTSFPIEIGLNPVDTATGRQVLATVADISHRRQLERNFRNIVEAAPVGMLIVDTDGRITHSNKQLLDTFGYSQDELQGQALEILLPERHRSQHQNHRNSYLQNPTTRSMGDQNDLTGRHKSGTEIPVEIGLNPIETVDGIAVIAAVSDITERKKTELKLRQALADLDEFTYVASHDLKSPLRGISSLVEWIAEDFGEDVPQEISNNLERIQLRIGRMEKLVDDLLDYARAGKSQNMTDTVNLAELIDNAIQLVDPSGNFQIETTGFLDSINTAATPLETVLRNLVSNAIKHHDKPKGCIRIEVSTDGAYCVFDVIDDGPGIPPNAHERVFKLFQALIQGSDSRSGVGLAVSKRLVEAHGGRIELHSAAEQRGARFRFWWPRFPRRDLNE
ncbi:MAG: PAS domain S-box protein [Chromatiales bacterium]